MFYKMILVPAGLGYLTWTALCILIARAAFIFQLDSLAAGLARTLTCSVAAQKDFVYQRQLTLDNTKALSGPEVPHAQKCMNKGSLCHVAKGVTSFEYFHLSSRMAARCYPWLLLPILR